MEIALYDVKNRLSEIVRRVEQGEHFSITRRGKTVAVLSAPSSSPAPAEATNPWKRWLDVRQEMHLSLEEVREFRQQGQK
jgi:prevent-host-death family protein